MRDTSQQIARQVAFKGAVEMLTHDQGEWNRQAIIDEVAILTDEFEAIIHKESVQTN